jgi:rubredoxin
VTAAAATATTDCARDARISRFNTAPERSANMALEKDVDCPDCGGSRSFYRTAAMTLHLGEKTKWRCPDCGYGYVEIDGIDTLPA